MRTDAHRKYAACGVHPAQETNQNANVLFVSYNFPYNIPSKNTGEIAGQYIL